MVDARKSETGVECGECLLERYTYHKTREFATERSSYEHYDALMTERNNQAEFKRTCHKAKLSETHARISHWKVVEEEWTCYSEYYIDSPLFFDSDYHACDSDLVT